MTTSRKNQPPRKESWFFDPNNHDFSHGGSFFCNVIIPKNRNCNVTCKLWPGNKSVIGIELASSDLHLRIGLLKPFLAISKKTKQGPGWRFDALCISRCWFYLTVVAIPKQIQKDYKIIWFCVLLWYHYCYDFMIQMLMICEWWSERCLWNDYEIGRIMEWWIGS